MIDHAGLIALRRELEQISSELSREPNCYPVDRLTTLMVRLIDCVAEAPPSGSIDLAVGQEVILGLRVKATVVDRGDSHGLCFRLMLERRDYVDSREVCVDADEIVAVSPL